jgi:hypothetical protein
LLRVRVALDLLFSGGHLKTAIQRAAYAQFLERGDGEEDEDDLHLTTANSITKEMLTGDKVRPLIINAILIVTLGIAWEDEDVSIYSSFISATD